MVPKSRGILVVCGLLTVSIVGGCGRSKPWETAYPAVGILTHKGRPVKDAELAFFPVDANVPESVLPKAKTRENGEFDVSTYDNGDGAPAGKYKVTVIHHEIVIKGESMTAKPNDLPKKFASKETTDLIVEIDRKATKIPPIDLK